MQCTIPTILNQMCHKGKFHGDQLLEPLLIPRKSRSGWSVPVGGLITHCTVEYNWPKWMLQKHHECTYSEVSTTPINCTGKWHSRDQTFPPKSVIALLLGRHCLIDMSSKLENHSKCNIIPYRKERNLAYVVHLTSNADKVESSLFQTVCSRSLNIFLAWWPDS